MENNFLKNDLKQEYKQLNPEGSLVDIKPSSIMSCITKVEIRSGAIIDAIGVCYNNENTVWNGGNGGSLKGFTLTEDEYITKVSGEYGIFNGRKYISRLIFETSKGKIYDFGCRGNQGNFSYSQADRYIRGFCIRVNGSYISDMGIYYMESGGFSMPKGF